MRTHLKPVALPLFLFCALSIRASQEEPKPPDLDKAERESTEQAFRAAIQKLREPLEEDQEFRALSSDVGRFETMREVSITFGHRVAHEEIDRDMKEHPKSAFERLMSFQSTGESPTLLGRLRSEKPRLTPESNIDLKWITNQLKAVNLLLDRAQLGSHELRRLHQEKRELQNGRWRLQSYYNGGRGKPELKAEAVQAALEPGTVVLSYFAAQAWPSGAPIEGLPGGPSRADHIDLLVLSHSSPVTAHRIELPEDELRSLLHEVLPLGASVLRNEKRTVEASQRLYQALIAPAEEAIAASDRVLIIPDGVLYELPFGALRRRDQSGASSYFVEWKPVHVAQSMAIYLELLARREREDRKAVRRDRRLVAFGDPVYREDPSSDHRADRPVAPVPMAVRFAIHRGLTDRLQRLPDTGREVAAIADLFRAAGAPAEVLLRAEASEQAAKERAAKAAYVHFALHGVLDPEEYESSFLALTLPNAPPIVGEDGILEAWEIADQLDLSADLVTLSACETALGRAAYGEGVLSLSHAFQMAGTQSVVASLWRVADDSTADLMARFYNNLLKGLSKDRALQEAQIAMLRGELGQDRSAPYHWAAFQLFGDWR